MSPAEIRSISFGVLSQVYPRKLSAHEIAQEICRITGETISRAQVHYALRSFSMKDKRFACFLTFFPYRIFYSVYI